MSEDQLEIELLDAVRHNRVSKVRHLLEQGVTPNSKIGRAAIWHNRRECTDLLIQYDIKLTADIFHVAVCKHQLSWIAPLLRTAPKQFLEGCYRNFGKDTALHILAHQGWVDDFELLVTSGANPNVKNADGHTPLQSLCSRRPRLPITVFQAIIDVGGDISVITKNGLTLLDLISHPIYDFPFDDGDEDLRKLLSAGGSCAKGARRV